MASRFLVPDREQSFLQPTSFRELLGVDHLVWTVIDTVEAMDLSGIYAGYDSGYVAGRPAFDPAMLVTLLVFGYCEGRRSSRELEEACYRDVAYRAICGGMTPDHTTIARFRADLDDQMESLFVQVLIECARRGLIRVGRVAVDGTRIEAAASMDANVTGLYLEELESRVRVILAEVEQREQTEREAHTQQVDQTSQTEQVRFTDHDTTTTNPSSSNEDRVTGGDTDTSTDTSSGGDTTTTGGGDVTGDTASDTSTGDGSGVGTSAGDASSSGDDDDDDVTVRDGWPVRRRRVEVEDRLDRVGRAQIGVVAAQQRRDDDLKRRGRVRTGEAVANVTDPDSRMQKTRRGFLQGYNAQAVVSQDQVVIAAEVTAEPTDVGMFETMIQRSVANLATVGVQDRIGMVLADAGYWSKDNAKLEKSWRMRLLIAPTKRHRVGDVTPIDPATATEAARERFKMQTRLAGDSDKESYRQRGWMIEGSFAHTKTRRRSGRFMRRGITACAAEWQLINLAGNITKLHRARSSDPNRVRYVRCGHHRAVPRPHQAPLTRLIRRRYVPLTATASLHPTHA